MATKRKKQIEVDLDKEFYTQEELDSITKADVTILGSFWSGGKQFFKVSLLVNSEIEENDH